MTTYIIKRLLLLIPTIVGILLVTFLIQAFIPTDAVAQMYLGTQTEAQSAEAVANMRAKFHLDEPWYIQFAYYIGNIAKGDLGISIKTREPVTSLIGYRYVNTIKLTAAALVIAVIIGVGTGILSAYYKDTIWDMIGMGIGLFGLSMPAFFFGIILLFFFAVKLRWFPVVGFGDWRHLILPAFNLGIIESASLSRVTRASMLEVMNQDYIRAARAKGLRERIVVFKHILRNALLPVVTNIGLQIGGLLGGAFIIEVVFAWHGIGELAVKAIGWRDFAITQAIILVSAVTYVMINLIVDILYKFIDPRVSLSE
ncbi:MAG: ABC transporter permease [Chloroflexi bacterium]|nr:ABC transporter permease [Chloroflexota bacterium]